MTVFSCITNIHRQLNAMLSPCVSERSVIISVNFYRAMHFSAKRGIAIACRLSVCLSVCNVGEL